MDEFNQHATGTACRIVNRISSLRIMNFDQQLNYRTGSVELAAGLLCNFSKLLDKVFISITHDIGRIVTVTHMDGGQMFKKMCTVRTANYTRADRTAIGHEIKVRYIAK